MGLLQSAEVELLNKIIGYWIGLKSVPVPPQKNSDQHSHCEVFNMKLNYNMNRSIKSIS